MDLITDFNLTPQNLQEAEAVIVGGGPIGLWTAIQTKLDYWNGRIVILEKNTEYKRKHVLRINPSSLPNLGAAPKVDEIAQKEFSEVYDSFKALVADFKKRKVIPTLEIESKLKEIALKAGIILAVDNRQPDAPGVDDPAALPSFFPNAKIFIGADGTRSGVREKVFQDQIERTALQHVVQIKYKIDGTGEALGSFAKVGMKFRMGHFAQEHIGHLNEEDDESPATLQIFINKISFDKLKDVAKSSNPIKLAQLKQLAPEVASQIQAWFDEKSDRNGEVWIEGKEEISVIPLEYYSSKRFILKVGEAVWAVIGDAGFGVPFFRSINNGFLCGTVLAKAIAEALKTKPEEQKHRTSKWSIFNQAATFENYESYAKRLAFWEIKIAQIKSLFLSVYIFLLKLFHFRKGISHTANNWVEQE